MAKKTFVGFGFGPIQSGLMALEAQASGRFDRFVIAEVVQDLVDAVRAGGDRVIVNVAHQDGVRKHELTDLEILNPKVAKDRAVLARAIADADEMATAIPSVELYDAGGKASVAALLADNVNPDKPQILYASENNNYAASALTQAMLKHTAEDRLAHFYALDTVIGKMSGVIDDPETIERLDLSPFVEGGDRAVLVEAFNRILVSAVPDAGVTRGIKVFEEKAELLPFEEAKLFGHNAIHALLGYLAAFKGLDVMSRIREDPELMGLARRAFIDESGGALLRKYTALGDPLFTPQGYREYAEDLITRMTNPYLNDKVARICRDPLRKLSYGDRLVGTMREALAQGIEPLVMAQGAAAALHYIVANGIDVGSRSRSPETPALLTPGDVTRLLDKVWHGDKTDRYRSACHRLIVEAYGRLIA